MGLFAKKYHPLDSRHPRNKAGAQAGTYGVQTREKPVQATPERAAQTPREAAPTDRPAKSRKMSQAEQMFARAEETRARLAKRSASDRAQQDNTAHAPFSQSEPNSTFSASAEATKITETGPARFISNLGGLTRGLSKIYQVVQVCIVILAIWYLLLAPPKTTGLTPIGPSQSLQTAPADRSGF